LAPGVLDGTPGTGFFPLALALDSALSAMRSFFVKILGASFFTGGATGLVESFSFAF
jgi:cytochrome bd-type quinol oxidase subunit 1